MFIYIYIYRLRLSYHDHLVVLDFSDKFGLFAVPLLDVDQLVSLQSHCGLKRRKEGNAFCMRSGEIMQFINDLKKYLI